MSIGSAVKREVRVALSKKAQPVWFRFVKWAVVVVVGTLLWQGPYFWWWISGSLAIGVAVHAIWRWKTKAWTQPWGGWNDLESGGER
jgi:hypothetical protein